MLTSLQNPLVKNLRKLHQAKERRKQGLVLLEGTNLVEAAIAQGCFLETVLYTEAWAAKYSDLQKKLGGDRLTLVSPEVLEKVATTQNPDGIVATLRQDFLTRKPPANMGLGIVLDQIQDPGNVGTILRTAAATAVDAVLLSGDSVSLDNPKVLRASVGAWFQTPAVVISDLATQIRQYQAQGVQAIATLPDAKKSYWDLDWQRPSLILVGNEGAGLSPELTALADEAVTIPMAPGVESLNAAIACSVMLYEAKRQRDTAR